MVYDACLSGSFIPQLTPMPGKPRIIATSTSMNQDSIYVDDGTLSFSFIFWSRIFHGDSFYKSFTHASNTVMYSFDQYPQIEGDGDLESNQENDKETARKIKIGDERKSLGSIPVMGNVTPEQTLKNTSSTLIFAEDVSDPGGIKRVWAVITPPDYIAVATGTPVTDLPVVELTSSGNQRYESTYDQFIQDGTYHISIFAMDKQGDISLPNHTTIYKNTEQPLNADFGSDKITGSAPLTVQFTNQSTGNITSYYWNFGDGNTNTESNPKYTYYQPGTYQVSLRVKGPDAQEDTETKAGYIIVTSPDDYDPATDPEPNPNPDDGNDGGGGGGCFISTLQ